MKEKLKHVFASEGYKKFEEIEKGLIVGMAALDILTSVIIIIGR